MLPSSRVMIPLCRQKGHCLSLNCCMLTAQLMQIRCPHTSLTGRQLISQQSGHAKSSNCGTTETRSCDSCEQTAFAIASGITEPGCIVLGNVLAACSCVRLSNSHTRLARHNNVRGVLTLQYLVNSFLVYFLEFDIQKKLFVDMHESFKGFVASREFEGILQPFSYNLALKPLELFRCRRAIPTAVVKLMGRKEDIGVQIDCK